MGKITVMGRSPTDSRDGCYFFLYLYIHTDAQRPSLCVSLDWTGQLIRQGGAEGVGRGEGMFSGLLRGATSFMEQGDKHRPE